ncbi:glycosyltransferase [Enterocloster aldenensis]|uniref:glycosyltransferase n=1 Tax=Enterocloster aldenensis TaxID=358742 RepID=UPI000E4F7681|nr:glycosyltransferase [Enterocloster aldenensis]
MKKLGVVVPVHNAESYLEQCIISILSQTYCNLEIVLVDDGSTDNSGGICDEYAQRDNRIHVVHQKNQGMTCARYNGLREIKAEYATFVDADDWIKNNTYEKMAIYMEQGIDVISFNIIRYYGESYEFVSKTYYPAGKYDEQAISEKIFPSLIWNIDERHFGLDPSLCNKIIKRDLLIEQLEQVSKLPISYGEDSAVIFPLVTKVKSLMLTDMALYYHRQRKRNEMAEYLADKNFYRKLLLFYDYMIGKFEGQQAFIKQLDFLFAHSAELHLKKYKRKSQIGDYLFPYNKITVNQKIILYGAGNVGQSYYEQLRRLNYGKVVAWVDKNSEWYSDLGVSSIDKIKEVIEYDYIVIAVNKPEVAKVIRHNLISLMNVREEKIIWGFNS